VKHYENKLGNEVILKGINYGYDIDTMGIPNGSKVYLVDYSVSPIEKFLEFAKNHEVIWIDHHISAINDFNKLSVEDQKTFKHVYVRSGDKAACLLVWEYFNSDKAVKVVPPYVQLCSDYDIWNKSNLKRWEEEILPFQMGLRSEDTDPIRNPNFWHQLINSEDPYLVSNFIKKGSVIINYQRQQDIYSCKSKSYEREFEGLKWIVMNGGSHNSNTFLSVYDPLKHDGMIQFSYTNKGYWSVSFYTTKEEVDCSLIAKKYGGGGHKMAAGCQVKDISFLL
jgi:oligoribonuclease NrnB/cAMP/cGMP phosphodiesterase (DHH superfamily)